MTLNVRHTTFLLRVDLAAQAQPQKVVRDVKGVWKAAISCGLLLMVCGYSLAAQNTSKAKQLPLTELLEQLEQTYDCHFLYEAAVLKGQQVSIDWLEDNQRLTSIIQELRTRTKLEFEEIESTYWVVKPSFSYGKFMGYVYNSLGEPLVGASVFHAASQRGTATDLSGRFELWLPAGELLVQISYVGYQPLQLGCWIPFGGQLEQDYQLENSLDLGEILVVSAPTNSLAFLAPSAPTETVTGDALTGIPVSELGQLLQFAAPSFHATYQTNSDGTDHIDPASLRGLGPDQLLVLVNGKRRHTSALVNVNSTVGRGSVATDLNAIPLAAIDHVEILPDGATAQYGADAIAGVINLVLKDSLSANHLEIFSGITSEGDGLRYGLGGYQQLWQSPETYGNLSWRLDYRGGVNRSGNYTGSVFGDERDEDPTQLAHFFAQTGYADQRVMQVGSAEVRNAGLSWNMAGQWSPKTDWYAFGGFNLRQGNASGFYRFPYQKQKQSGLYEYGFSPRIQPQIQDVNQVFGLRHKVNDWQLDMSANWGGNAVTFYIENSNNASLGLQSPVSARAGELRYSQYQLQLDALRLPQSPKGYTLRLGTAWRNEQYRQFAGDEWSWQNYGDTTMAGLPREAGIQVFPGFRPSSTVRMNRASLSAYAGLERCWNDRFFPTAALRWEYWPGSGHHLLGKLSLRYRLSNDVQIRTAFNTGLRPPSLPQLYFSSQTLQFVPQGEKLIGQEVAQLNSTHPFSQQLLQEDIQAERSRNFSWGIDWQLRPNVLFQLSAYQIAIRERIILSSRLKQGENQRLDQLLIRHELGAVQLFMNALRTRTNGLDISLQQNWLWRDYQFNLRLASSFNRTKLLAIDVPESLKDSENRVFNREEQARLETAQPNSKVIAHLAIQRATWSVEWQTTRFGAVTYLHPADADAQGWVINEFTGLPATRDQRFSSKWLHDLSLRWKPANSWTIGLHSRNIFNIYPDEHAHSANTNDGVFRYSRYVQQFGVWGAQFMLDTRLTF